MIGRLRGQLVECTPSQGVLEAGGVGYRVQFPLSTFYRIAASGTDPVVLWIHTHVREDAIQLFGFASPEERDSFERLIGITGVGPKIALAVLSGIGVDELAGAVLRSDRQRLERIPGIGRKTAERILLELRDRIGKPGRKAGGRETEATPSAPGAAVGDGDLQDAQSALENLGYGSDAARRAIDAARTEVGPEAGIEALLKAAFRRLVR